VQQNKGVARVGHVPAISVDRERASIVTEWTSFDDFVRDHQVALVRYAVLLSGSRAHAEDLVQEVLVRMYPRWAELTSSAGSIGAYVRRSITNEYLSWRRRWSTRHIHLSDTETMPDAPYDPWAGQRDERLWQLLLRLPGQQRAAVVLRYYEGLADGEIAEILDCRPATVRAHISRGLAKLRLTIDIPVDGEACHG
jgi:RNA polymerase sigma-70 factor (sigma-E family)